MLITARNDRLSTGDPAVNRQVEVFCASDLRCCRLRIEGARPFPVVVDMAHAFTLYRSQAKALADALDVCLPEGTLDQLLAELLERRASVFRGARRR